MSFYFSFFQGMLAFLAPCAVALLPAYIASFVSRNHENKLISGLKLASFSILGILVIYATAGVLIIIANQLIKEYLKYIVVALATILILLGLMMATGKTVSLPFHIKQKRYNSEIAEAFFFGIAYAIGALGCLFPLFLVVITLAFSAPNTIIGVSYIFAYFLGMSTLMVTSIMLAIYAKKFLQKNLTRILPYIERFSGILLILAGIYIINYQRALF